jgi:O-antigen/teichoic acid export membrane protein
MTTARPSEVSSADKGAHPTELRLRHRILSAGGWAGAGFVCDKVLAAGQLMVVARLLAPSDFGLVAASAAVILAFATFSELGIEPALIAKSDVQPDDLAVAWTIAMARGSVMTMAVWLTADWIGDAMGMPSLGALLKLHACALLLQALQSPAMALLVKRLDWRRRVSADLLRRVIETGATIAIAWWMRSAWALVAGQLIGLAAGGAFSFLLGPFRPRLSFNREAFSYFARYGRHVNPTTLCMYGVMSGGELIIGRLLGQEALGHYQIALAIPLLVGVRATALIHQLSVPTYAILRQDVPGLRRVFELQFSVVGLLFIPVAAGTAAFAPSIVRVAFGAQWLAAVEPLRVLCFYAVCAGFASVMTALQYGLNRPDLQLRSWALMLGLYALAIVPMTDRWGLSGAAGALAVSYAAGIVVQGLGSRAILGPDLDRTLRSAGLVAALAGGVMACFMVPGLPLLSPRWMVVATGLGLGFYGWYLWSVEMPRLRGLWNHRYEGG